MSSALAASGGIYLVPLAGPPVQHLALSPKPGGLVIGRHEQCDLCLPADAEKVSRFHARFDYDGARWHLADLNSRWGTFVNGIKLLPHADVPLSDGDLVRITPWTFVLSASVRRRAFQASDDAGQTLVRTFAHDATRPPLLADAMLALLLESAAAIHAAGNEKQLAELLMDAAVRGTGLQNAAMLRPAGAEGQIELIASHFATAAQDQGVTFSRSLIMAASQGAVAEIDSTAPAGAMANISQSIIQLRINSAICVPLMLGPAVAAYLYLDSRGTLTHAIRPGGSGFCAALGRIGSLALANLKRLEMEGREAAMRAELSAAAAAQKWIMPSRTGQFGPFFTIGESKPGQYVGGDFFDIIPLGEKRLAVAVGDVSGKGISASVLMTATQGYLHAALAASGDVALAVNEVNRFINPRRPENKFVTMWVGVFDAEKSELNYVDAGHSYATLQRVDGGFEPLDKGDGPPIGVEDSHVYRAESINIGPGDEVMIVSDGIIEQFGMVPLANGLSREQFQMDGMRQSLARATEDAVADLFAAVMRHAGSEQLSDDATAVLVKWKLQKG